jgi:hypothetical protein
VLLGVPVLLFFLNLVWFYKMLMGAVKLVKRRSSGGGKAGPGGAPAGEAPVLVQAYAAAADARKEE